MPTTFVRQLFSPRMLVAFLMGFACGVPLLLTGSVLQAWMTEEGVDLTVIGLYSLVGLPYTLKFLWAPVFDRFTLPLFGRRRGWMLVTQVCLIVGLIGLGLTDPARSPWVVAGVAFLVTFLSASQDIVIDAYRREDLRDNELGLGSSLYVNGYRLGMLLAGSGGLILADHFSFAQVYLMMAATLLVGVVTTLSCREPALTRGTPRTFREAVVEPFTDYFRRDHALALLLFILLYKLGDQMASTMTTPFYLDLGFTKTQIGAVAKLFGFWSAIAGGLLGGAILMRIGIVRSLWAFGILQGAIVNEKTGDAALQKIARATAAVIERADADIRHVSKVHRARDHRHRHTADVREPAAGARDGPGHLARACHRRRGAAVLG